MIQISQYGKRRIRRAIQESLCVACLEPLDDTRVVCGCHERCYRATLRAVASGQVTREHRIRQGKLLEPDTGGRNPSNPVSKEVAG